MTDKTGELQAPLLDQPLDDLVRLTGTNAALARQIGQELTESQARLEEIDRDLAKAQDQLTNVINKTKSFMEERRCCFWVGCVTLSAIIVILMIMLLMTDDGSANDANPNNT
jgi:hypothetical protein